MRESQLGQAIRRWEGEQGGCKGKQKFHSQAEAQMVVDDYNHRVALQFGVFGVYFCTRHQRWHVGHKGRRAAILAVLRLRAVSYAAYRADRRDPPTGEHSKFERQALTDELR